MFVRRTAGSCDCVSALRLQFAAILDGVLSKLSRYDEGTFFSSILSFTVSSHVAELLLSPLTEATCYLLETRSSQLNFSVILLLLLLLLPASPPPASPHQKVKAAAKYVEVPVSPSICLLFYYSPCRFPYLCFHPHSESRSDGWKCKEAALCIQSCAFV